jgi:hypothetical protein
MRQLQELTPEEHAEGVVEIKSPGWSEAEPWVLLICHPLRAAEGSQRVFLECWDKPRCQSVRFLLI